LVKDITAFCCDITLLDHFSERLTQPALNVRTL